MRRNSNSNQPGERRDVRLHSASHENKQEKIQKEETLAGYGQINSSVTTERLCCIDFEKPSMTLEVRINS